MWDFTLQLYLTLNIGGSGKLIQQAYQKYPLSNFSREILDWAETRDELEQKERQWIETLGTYECGYNLTQGGDGGVTWKNPEDNPSKQPGAREKIRQQKLAMGENHPMKRPEMRKRISEANAGKHVGLDNPMARPDIKAKYLEACRSEEHRQAISKAGRALGENHPSKRPKQRQLMSELSKKNWQNPEYREKMSQVSKQNSQGANNPHARRVKIIETGQEFECIKYLCEYLQVGGWTIDDRLKHHIGRPINSPVAGKVTIAYVIYFHWQINQLSNCR